MRTIEDVIRLGHVRRISRDQIVLDGGTVPTTPDTLHVHCAARGVRVMPAKPIFDGDVIRPQMVRFGFACFSAAFVAFVEATRSSEAEKNELCVSIPMTDGPEDWISSTLQGMNASYRWYKSPDIAEWVEESRLNVTAGLQRRSDDPAVQRSFVRFAANAAPAAANLRKLMKEAAAR
jgi:hypothetical protein